MICQAQADSSSVDEVCQQMVDDLIIVLDEAHKVDVLAIIKSNYRSGRMTRSLAAGHYASPSDYAHGVANHFLEWHPTIWSLRRHPDDPAWSALYERLYQAAKGQLARAVIYLSDELNQLASDCASDTLLRIYHGRYPFDCNFYAWAYAILRNVCQRALYDLGHSMDLLYHCRMSIDIIDEYCLPHDDTVEPGTFVGLAYDLERATKQLSTSNRRAFAQLYYFEGKSYSQIAHEMGKSMGALYKLNNDIIADYRRHLA